MRAWKQRIGWIGVLVCFCLPGVGPALAQEKVPKLPPSAAKDDAEMPDLVKLSPFQRTIYLSARRGADWLWLANRADGLFIAGQIPTQAKVVQDDNYVLQAGGAVGLSRAARFIGSTRFEIRAKQAVLTLLADTKTDAADGGIRIPASASTPAQRLAGAGMVVWAIHELPHPGDDLLKQSDELCQGIRKQQQPNGSFAAGEPTAEDQIAAGTALLGLMRSQVARPAAWKLDAARKSLPYFRSWWKTSRTPQATAWLLSAYSEAYLLTKEQPFADAVTEMADWLSTLQIGIDLKNLNWQGGFGSWANDRVVAQAPGIESALYVQGLTDACRAARQMGDVEKIGRYRETAERGLQFLTLLQYTPANARQFAEGFQRQLYGAFFASFQDGNTRLDYTQHALYAMCQYLDQVAEAPLRTR